MSLTTVLSVSVRPDRRSAYEAHVHRLADKAREQKEALEWATYEVVAGPIGTLHFVAEVRGWTEFAAREPIQLFIRRVMGETEGTQLIDQLNECAQSERLVIGRDRPDLSCPPPEAGPRAATSVITLIHARAGGEDACEEFIRKVGQAIPLVGDPRRYLAYQTVVGDPRMYWAVTPVADVAELDRMLMPQDLLPKAFGAEGALVYRSGLDAMLHMERRMTVLRPELSNAAWLGDVVGISPQRPAAAAETAH